MRVAAVQYDIVWENKPANHRIVETMLDEAGIAEGAYVVLPELGDTGFSFDLDAIVDDASLEWARELARSRRIWLQPGFAVRGDDGLGRNRAAIISPAGEVHGIYEKVHPFSFGRESEYYAGGGHILVRDCDEVAVCPVICYDLRFPELWRAGVLAGAELFTIGASWPNARQHHWRALAIARAIENQAYVVAVNRVGRDPHLAYDGGSIIVSPLGDVLAEADDAPAVLQVDLDLAALRAWRTKFPALRDIKRELLGSMDVDVRMDR